MTPAPAIAIILLACTSYVAWGASLWKFIRTDDMAWQSACGNSKRVGAVCLNAQYGERKNFVVQSNAYQNVVFSANGKYFMAYCPNRDKGESTYSINYGTAPEISTLIVLGRTSNQTCCDTSYIPAEGGFAPTQCIKPSLTSGAFFPRSQDVDEDDERPKLSPGGTN